MLFRAFCTVVLCFAFAGAKARKTALPDSLQTKLSNAVYGLDSVKAFNSIGSHLLLKEFKFEESLTSFNLALSKSEKINEFQVRPIIQKNIAYANQMMGNYEKAQEFYLKAILLFKNAERRAEEAEAYAYLGDMMQEQGRVEKALRYYEQVNEISEAVGFKNSRAQSLNAIAKMNLMKGEYARTIEFYLEATEQFKKDKNYNWLAYIYSQLAQVCINIGGFAQAIEYANTGLNIATKHKLVKETYDNYLALSDIYSAMEEYPKALRYYKLYNTLRDSVFTEESRQNIAELEDRIKQEQQDRELQLLKEKASVQELKANKQLLITWSLVAGLAVIIMVIAVYYNRFRLKQKHASLLQTTLKEKETMLQEIHHRIKNNLQLVSSLLNLQSSSIKDERARELIIESKNRVQSMALVHQKLFQSDDRENVGFREYLFLLVENVEHSYTGKFDKIDFDIDCPDISFNLDTAIPLGLMINELLTNACKHAFENRKTGTVSIAISKEENKYKLLVTDDGTGMPDDFDIDDSESLGLEIVRSLTEQLNGAFNWENNNGAVFSVVFEGSEKRQLKN